VFVQDPLDYYLSQPAFIGMSAGSSPLATTGNGADQLSLFTSVLLRVMRDRADSPRGDGAFTFRQLATQVKSEVEASRGHGQTPKWGRLGVGDGDFVFQPTIDRTTPTERSEIDLTVADVTRYGEAVQQAFQACQTGDRQRAMAILEGCKPPPGQLDLRGFEWYFVDRLCAEVERAGKRVNSHVRARDSAVERIENVHAREVHAIAYSPDGNSLATGGSDTVVRVWDAATGRIRANLGGHTLPVWAVAYSPDGNLLATTSGSRVKLWNTATWKELRGFADERVASIRDSYSIVHEFSVPVVDVEFSPDGRYLVLSNSKSVIVWRIGSRGDGLVLDNCLGPVCFSPDGEYLACRPPRAPALYLWPTTTWRDPRSLPLGQLRPFCPVFSPDSAQVAILGPAPFTGQGLIVQRETLDRVKLVLSDEESGEGESRVDAHGIAFDPDGTRVATITSDPQRRLTLWETSTGVKLLEVPDVGMPMAFSPDGQTIAVGDGKKGIRLLRASKQKS
jgi:WD40 repeat protein